MEEGGGEVWRGRWANGGLGIIGVIAGVKLDTRALSLDLLAFKRYCIR